MSPAWPRLRVLRALRALLVVLLAPWRLWAIKDTQDCTWQVALNKFDAIGENHTSDRFFYQEPLDTVDEVFSLLVDAPIDPDKTYLGFPYYLKINYSCKREFSEALVRKGHLTGLKPMVLVSFQSPVNFYHWKIEQLQIQMEAAPFRSKELCNAEEVCVMSWYTPMPIKNGSVVMRVDVSSNGLGPFIPNKRCPFPSPGQWGRLWEGLPNPQVPKEDRRSPKGGNRAGGWLCARAGVGTLTGACPTPTASFRVNINGFLERQQDNTLRFTVGNELFNLIPRYFVNVPSRPLWYTVDQAPVLILGGIPEEKSILLTDTNFKDFFLVELSIDNCWVGSFCPQASFTATIYDAIATESTLFIRQNQLVYYFTGTYITLHESNHGSEKWVHVLDNECVKKLCPVHFHSNGSEYIMALTAGKHEGYVYLGTITDGRVSFELLPRQRSVCDAIKVVNCSITWAVFVAGHYNLLLLVETEDASTRKYFQLVYLIDNQQGRLVKRLVPVEQLLMYQQLSNGYHLKPQGGHLTLSFTEFCPFMVLRLRDLPNPQTYTRQERYRAQPPRVLEPSGFHNEISLAVYQGLVYYLLWLHSVYDKPYADPVHDPTWRWWKDRRQDQDYYFYLASNWRSAGKVHIDMTSYEKIYDLKAEYELPERIFLDKGTSYSFSIFLTAQGHLFKSEIRHGVSVQPQSRAKLAVVLGDPGCIKVVMKKEVLINRYLVLLWVTLSDKRSCFDQGISGHHLRKTSMLVKVVGSAWHCFQNTLQGPRMQGNLMIPVLIGCPPGKRLAFDITYTLEYSRLQNKHYFDCAQVDREMPCFFFRDIFYPFFLIQDLVTGDSGSFQGSYVLKVVGGGPTMDTIKEYSEEEIYRFNSPLDKTRSLIWTTKNTTTKDSAFHIMSHNSLGIEWLCLENSPCYDTIPHSIFAPEFYFKVLVSNRGVDKSTYCDYQLTFLLHIHGLPLSAKRAFFILMVSASLFVGLVILYLIFCLLLPCMMKACNVLHWKISNIMASESYTYSTHSNTRVFIRTSGTKSGGGSRGSSRVIPKAVQENKDVPKKP
ncbi:cation channel sperm-associated protein subunit gamma isoform X16 [Camelus ferus]|uniref:Cation channel sperm-associated protein subunit gamma isoform X16 n=2 Tax=Camelus TaxID=9836 RepID=A0A8B8TII8_CAMFR|nr:cation channel sperm-associated protein subunit gamma isoform X16 [Camelus ferus]XP_045379433.1 cation channel sperm-associated protein subunit gamma isoform X13 [Camelus bactrianus]